MTDPCRACQAPMLWAIMPSGKRNPLNAETVKAEVGKGVIAFNPNTGNGVPVTVAVIRHCGEWSRGGVTFHTSHFATCPARAEFRRTRGATHA